MKVDDTTVGIGAGINAGAWTVGITQTGNLVSLSEREFHDLPETDRANLVRDAGAKMEHAGAHFVIAAAHELPATIEAVDSLLAAGTDPSQFWCRHRDQ